MQRRDDGLKPVVLVTDHHSSVKKLMADRFKDTLHYFDVWHLAKGKLMCAWWHHDMEMLSVQLAICDYLPKGPVMWCFNSLTHWGRVTHICISKLTIIHSDNGLLPGRRQNLIWTNAKILWIGHLGTNFSENLIGIKHFHSRKCTLHCRLRNGVHFIFKDWGDLAMAMGMCWPVWALHRWGNITLKH